MAGTVAAKLKRNDNGTAFRVADHFKACWRNQDKAEELYSQHRAALREDRGLEPMEPRNAIGDYDPATSHYTLYAGAGLGVVKYQQDLAEILGVPPEQCRALCGDMGGNFGTRNFFFPEFGCCRGRRDAPGGRLNGAAIGLNHS